MRRKTIRRITAATPVAELARILNARARDYCAAEGLDAGAEGDAFQALADVAAFAGLALRVGRADADPVWLYEAPTGQHIGCRVQPGGRPGLRPHGRQGFEGTRDLRALERRIGEYDDLDTRPGAEGP